MKHIHMTLVALAVILFVVQFVLMKLDKNPDLRRLLKRGLTFSHIAILLIGFILLWELSLNPLSETGYWVLEKIIAFGAYIAMVNIALKPTTAANLQILTFLGAFGWLAYIGKLAVSHHAILLAS
ncbi:MAG TPA: hypothetical protein EYH12_05320 [Psychromonas hadalis]|nr:hypothetical protein [Psychromonas hadalis]